MSANGILSPMEIARRRLANQRIAGARFEKPAEVVAWLGAVQAQDYPAAKWGVGLRTRACREAEVERAVDEGAILRTHVLRPTWHFAVPADLRWMLALTGPRVIAGMAYYYRQLGLDEATFARSSAALARALEGGRQRTRAELEEALRREGFETQPSLRFLHMLMRAELDGIICSGAQRGKQNTYALLDERVPPAPALARDEALAGLARRYFTSRGPATLKDFAWWSGLTLADAKAGVEMVKDGLVEETIEGQTCWRAESAVEPEPSPTAYLLPNYDEYTVAYADRSAIWDGRNTRKLDSRDNSLMTNVVVIDGLISGSWKRSLRKDGVAIEIDLVREVSQEEVAAVEEAKRRYAGFVGKEVV